MDEPAVSLAQAHQEINLLAYILPPNFGIHA